MVLVQCSETTWTWLLKILVIELSFKLFSTSHPKPIISLREKND
jgi:hypothetical protein